MSRPLKKLPATRTELERLVGLIEHKLDEIGPGPDFYHDGRQAWQDHMAAGRAVIDHLKEAEGASYRQGVTDSYRLKLGGVATSCTGGDFGLLRNWMNAARRQIDKLKEGND